VNIALRRPSPALVIACIALFVSMGGVSYGFATGAIDGREIRNGTITHKDVRNNEVRGADIRNSTIGGRDVAFNTLGGNDIKESTLGKVPIAAQADSAGALGGVPASGFVRADAPAFSALTLNGATTVPGEAQPASDVDGNRYVHLQGTFDAAGAGTEFTLPSGARPAATSRFVVPAQGTPRVLTVTAAGAASITGAAANDNVSLDGVSFAAAP